MIIRKILEIIVYISLGIAFGLFITLATTKPDNTVYTYDLVINNVSENNVEVVEEEVNSVSLKPIIYVDAGHGFDIDMYGKNWKYGFAEYGAVGESRYVQELALLLRERLEQEGYTVKFLSDFYVYEGKASRDFIGNTGRRDLFSASNCDMMIQLHYDASDDITSRGGHIIYSPKSLGSELLASCIVDEFKVRKLRLNEMYKETNYISKRDNLSVYNKLTYKPLILVECGYGCEGALDYKYLHEDLTKNKLVDAITAGVNKYYHYIIVN